jgi:predicted nucleotidyltransferase
MTLKQIREQYNISQSQAASIVSIPLRTYVRYESDESYGSKLKRAMIINLLSESCEVSEDKGIYTIEQIKNIVSEVVTNEYQDSVELCYLFGSYAKGNAMETSDVDLLISSDVKGLKFFGMVEKLRTSLHKKVDVLSLEQLKDNLELTNEILRDGIRIYG